MRCLTSKVLVLIAPLLACLIFPINSSQAAGVYVGVESRNTYTRWYEYAGLTTGNYYEEEFVLNGIQAGYLFAQSNFTPLTVYYGADLTLHPISWYTSWPDGSTGAFGARISLLSHVDYALNSDFSLAIRAGIAYLAAIGFGGDNRFHQETFGSYLPTVDAGLGVRWKGFRFLGAEGISIFYSASLIDLGVWTDNWYSNAPVSENWNNTSFSVSFDIGY